MKIELSEKNLIYILNSLNFLMRCMEYHYQITDIKSEVKHYFNYNNYLLDYDNIKILHRFLSSRGNKEFYDISDELFFKGQKDYLCTKEKDFKILQDSTRYENYYCRENKFKDSEVVRNKYSFFKKSFYRFIK